MVAGSVRFAGGVLSIVVDAGGVCASGTQRISWALANPLCGHSV